MLPIDPDSELISDFFGFFAETNWQTRFFFILLEV